MAFPASHKTVFVLDHGSQFAVTCQQNIEFDIFTKTRQPGIIPLAPVSKTLWSCAVEATIEYCRIVWDIFPQGRLIRFVVSDTSARFLNTWSQSEQTLSQLLESFAEAGPPVQTYKNDDYTILHGLNAAVEALCQCTEVQHEKWTSLSDTAGKVLNRGRVICITSLKSDAHAKSLEKCFQDALLQHNKLASGTDNLMPIHHCELVLINSYPVKEESIISNVPKREFSPILTSEVHSVKSGRHLAASLCFLVQSHYSLASTTVTGIPMKEEQNANSSANYDVELLHPGAAHAELYKTGFVNTQGVYITTMREGQLFETVTLKWCTPRSSSVELHYCTGAYRISPVDVNSRPSSCLTNFLLSGRAVMLEMPKTSGSKVLSHMLASHGGEIYIHTLATVRSILEDPPSISEGCGGRVTDYRINDFGEFMKQNKLFPLRANINGELPIERAKHQLNWLTQYWPMVISNTTIFNMTSHLEPLTKLIQKESLSTDDVTECNKVIYHLVDMETKGLTLPVPTMGTRGKGPRKEEQYRMMWNELETFIRVHCVTVEHRSVLDCLLECRKPLGDDTSPSGSNSKSSTNTANSSVKKTPEKYGKDDANDGDISRKDSDSFNKFLNSKSDFKDDTSSDIIKPPAKKICTSLDDVKNNSFGKQSLLSLWTNRLNSENSKCHVEFSGRLNSESSGPAKLYKNLSTEGNDD